MKTKTVLTADDAAVIIAACKAEADRQNLSVSVVVVDDGGHLIGAMRFEGASYQTCDVALGKARTAVMSRYPSSASEQVTLGRLSMLALTDRIAIGGGVPVLVDGQAAGAVAVSGATSEQDEQIARAGVDALTAG